ncbi:MAG: 2-oxoglutarate oxidoreductase [Verrucomicrobia bacterium]|nr:2-oxoglutarate oxidoreductase [Verrucomicrobiota bacterium]
MNPFLDERWLAAHDEYHRLEDYQGSTPRWCSGCGDHTILTALLRLCRDEQLPPEKTVFVSGIGCSSRFPHYLKTYGFHSLHGRALPVAEGIKLRRPDLHVFVTTGDGDCCSIGTAHWIHAIRYNMNLTVIMHDNHIYGLTKMQASPTSPRGLKSNTSPRGAYLDALNPLTTTLGVANVSFVAQAADWIPEVLHQLLSAAYRHRGFSFIRVLQRCPNYLPTHFDAWLQDPNRILLLTHSQGLQADAALARIYRNQCEHDPADLNRARELSSHPELMPIGILYRNEQVPCYEDVRRRTQTFTPEMIARVLDEEFDQFTVEPWVGAATVAEPNPPAPARATSPSLNLEAGPAQPRLEPASEARS